MTKEEIRHIEKEMQSYASDMTVGLCGRKPNHEMIVNGSGSFVRFRDKYGILTAAHVWFEELKKLDKFDSLQLLIHDKHSRICLDWNNSNVRAWVPEQDDVEDPKDNRKDICFLQILNPDIISILKSKCSFYPLDPKASFRVDSPIQRAGMLVGFPAQIQPIDDPKKLALFSYPMGGLKEYHTWDANWDCLSFDMSSMEAKMGVTSLGGMSGGAVWAFPVYRNPQGYVELLMKPPRNCFLAGVSYYERAERGRVTEVLACGPNSIYSGLLSYIN